MLHMPSVLSGFPDRLGAQCNKIRRLVNKFGGAESCREQLLSLANPVPDALPALRTLNLPSRVETTSYEPFSQPSVIKIARATAKTTLLSKAS